MSEARYTYKRVRLSDGTETYERVPYNPEDPVLEAPVIVPRLAPFIKNGEFQGGGSVVVDHLVAKTQAAAAQRALRDAQEAQDEADRINARLGRVVKPAAPQRPRRGRVLEP